MRYKALSRTRYSLYSLSCITGILQHCKSVERSNGKTHFSGLYIASKSLDRKLWHIWLYADDYIGDVIWLQIVSRIRTASGVSQLNRTRSELLWWFWCCCWWWWINERMSESVDAYHGTCTAPIRPSTQCWWQPTNEFFYDWVDKQMMKIDFNVLEELWWCVYSQTTSASVRYCSTKLPAPLSAPSGGSVLIRLMASVNRAWLTRARPSHFGAQYYTKLDNAARQSWQ